MKITFCFGGKKRFAAALLAAAMALFLFFGCSSGGDDGPGEIPQGSGANQGGGQNPSEGENQGGESGGGESEEGGNNNPSYSGLKEFFEENYEDEFKGVTQSTNITLTAQTIKDVVEKTPAFETQVKAVNTEEGKKKAIQDFNAIDDNSEIAIMAQVAGKLNIENKGSIIFDRIEFSNNSYGNDVFTYSNKYLISAKDGVTVSLSGVFNYAEVDIKFAEKINKNLKDATFNLEKDSKIWALYSSKFEEICSDLGINDIKETASLPKLNFALYIKDNGFKHFLDIYEKYNESTKMQITGNFSSTPFDGRELIDNSTNYTLFSSDNTEKTSGAPDIKSMDINTLVKFSNKYNVKDIKNIIVSGSANSGSSVNWTNLTNVIFEGNMSNLKINKQISLKGIVYFKDLPYNGNNDRLAGGAVRLKNLSNTISVSLEAGVLDLRDINASAMNIYTNADRYISQGDVYAIYFNNTLENTTESYSKIVRQGAGYHIYSAYFGTSTRQNSYNSYGDHPGAKTARSLKEFEYYGNNNKYEKSAYSTYNDDADIINTGASNTGVTNLKNDINKNLIAKNNKNIDFIRAEGLIPRRFAS